MFRIHRRAASLASILLVSLLSITCGEGCDDDDPLGIRPSMEIEPDGEIAILVGGVIQMDVETNNVEAPNITFVSDNPSAASVSDEGVITGLEEGATHIIVHESTENLTEQLLVEVVGPSGSAVILDHTLSAAFQQGDTIQLDRITNGRAADPDACDFVHLHTGFDGPGILIDGAGPFNDPNQPACGFGRIIAL